MLSKADKVYLTEQCVVAIDDTLGVIKALHEIDDSVSRSRAFY